MKRYRRLGFPGAAGSVDCTHVKWMMCAKDDKWLASGGKKDTPHYLSMQ
jgi:hypothetical protein